MSDIRINVYASDDATHRRTPTENRKRKNRWFRKKMKYLEKKGLLEGKHKHKRNHRMGQSRHDQAPPRQNGAPTRPSSLPASTHSKSLPRPSSTASAAHCSSKPSTSTHSLPSSTSTVNSRGHHEKPKEPVNTKSTNTNPRPSVSGSHKPAGTQTSAGIPTKYLAMDCEMVGTGPKGSISQLARCSVVSYEGDVVYDRFINPPVPVTDYRTRWSGIRRSDLIHATPYSEARKEVGHHLQEVIA